VVALFDVNDASSICCHILASFISMAFSNRVRHIIPLISHALVRRLALVKSPVRRSVSDS
jgi:hypothetical protein